MIESIFPDSLARANSVLSKFIYSTATVVKHKSGNSLTMFRLATPNYICYRRAVRFSLKEPETIDWLDEFGKGATLYDVGANIGVFSIYHALKNSENVFAFEPSVFNLRSLVKNISLNQVSDLVRIVSCPLSSAKGFGKFIVGDDSEGASKNAFGVNYGHDGELLNSLIDYSTFGLTFDEIYLSGVLGNNPSILKLDVDGIEDLILKGAINYLSSGNCISVLVESYSGFSKQKESVYNILRDCGFILNKEFRHDGNQLQNGMQNSIWVWAATVSR
ncbi:MAG: FkbM family methyltransferase [Beijerinckiaceae bacterium]|nr:FkbM family methyltransferase [Beijerinckiaceae bacterium]